MELHKRPPLKDDERLCIRCRGRKKLYKGMGGFCFDNMGGTLSTCPMCLGEGKISKVPKQAVKEAIEEIKDVKKARRRKHEKDF